MEAGTDTGNRNEYVVVDTRSMIGLSVDFILGDRELPLREAVL